MKLETRVSFGRPREENCYIVSSTLLSDEQKTETTRKHFKIGMKPTR